MKTIFEEMGGTYRQVGYYFIPNITLPDDGEYQIGKYGRMRRSYLKEYRKILYNNYVLEGTLFKHLAEIDQACNERIENIVSAMAKQEGVTEALKAADQIEWVRRMNSIRNRAEEIVLHLAFMRGRTLNDAVVILDEAQNTTTQQIKMFLTRMGMNTKMIVTGDMTQIDLPASQTSGLVQAIKILKGVKGISFIELNKKDIVRHKLVTRIVEAYEKFEEKEKAERKTTRTAKEPEKTPQA